MSRRFGPGLAMSVVVAFALCADVSRADPCVDCTRLIDHAPTAAVFEVHGNLRLVQVGQTVPGTDARLQHVGESGIQIEYFADADTLGGILLVSRGGVVPHALPRDAQASVPTVQITPLTADPRQKDRLRAASDPDATR